MLKRILVHDTRQAHGDWSATLSGKDRQILVCEGRESLVAAIAERRPDALVYVLSDLDDDIQLLIALRRLASGLPIIVLGGPTDLSARRSIQELKPTYYGVFPLDDAELDDVMSGALKRVSVR